MERSSRVKCCTYKVTTLLVAIFLSALSIHYKLTKLQPSISLVLPAAAPRKNGPPPVPKWSNSTLLPLAKPRPLWQRALFLLRLANDTWVLCWLMTSGFTTLMLLLATETQSGPRISGWEAFCRRIQLSLKGMRFSVSIAQNLFCWKLLKLILTTLNERMHF